MSNVPRRNETVEVQRRESIPSEDHKESCMNEAEFHLGPKALSRVETEVMVRGSRGLGH